MAGIVVGIGETRREINNDVDSNDDKIDDDIRASDLADETCWQHCQTDRRGSVI